MNTLKTLKILALLGIFLSIYLLWQQFAKPAYTPCTINATVNCDAIISGEVSSVFGISTPLFGFVGYIVILTAAFLKRLNVLLAATVFGLVFCLWIGYRELFELKVICPICIGCQTIMIGVFVLALKLKKDIQ